MTTVSFDPQGPPDPNDPRILPASMEFTLTSHGGRTYVEWSISKCARVDGTATKTTYPYVVRALLSPADVREIAQQLLDAAAWAEGGPGPGGREPPPPPPPPTGSFL